MSNQIEEVDVQKGLLKDWTKQLMRRYPDMPETLVESVLMQYLEDPAEFDKESAGLADALAKQGLEVKDGITEIHTMTVAKPGSEEYDLLLPKFQASSNVVVPEPSGQLAA